MLFREYTDKIEINGQTIDVLVQVSVHEDDDQTCLLDQDFESEQAKQKYISKIENQEIFVGGIEVVAKAEGLEGSDSIWGCELIPNNMFNSKPFEKSVKSYLKEYNLEKLAIDDLKRQLETEFTRLSEQANRYKKFSKA